MKIMNNKLTLKMIRKAVKILKKNEPKPDENGMINIDSGRFNKKRRFFSYVK